MKRILILTISALLLSAIGDNLMAQSKLMISADGITFNEDNDKDFQISSIVSANKKGVSIGGLASSTIPSIELGWNVLSNVNYDLYNGQDVNDFMKIREWKSTQVTVNLIGITANSNNHKIGFSTAIGIRANNYRLGNNTTLIETDGIVTPATITDIYGEMDRKKSKFTIASVHIPLEVQFGDPNKFAFSIGGYFDMVTSSHTKIKFDNGHKEKVHNFPVNFIQAGATMRLSFKYFSIYCSYQPTQMFKTGYGPKVQQWSIGIGLL